MTLCVGTKIVYASPMNREQYTSYRGWALPEDENGEDEGFLIEYTDGGEPNHPNHKGYISWSPKDQFENAYANTDEMPFEGALTFLKKGLRVSRKGWNGSGMYAVLMDGYPDGVGANEETARKHHMEIGERVNIRPYFVLKTAQDDLAHWVPSGSDILANDWVLVDVFVAK